MNRARTQIAKPDILKLFEDLPQKIFKQSDLATILQQNRRFWRLTQSTTTQDFIDFLLGASNLAKIVFPFPKPYNRETRYTWGEVPIPEVMLSLKPHCHFSHYTAVRIHGLTEQVPKTTYLNFEQPLASNSTGELSQRSIDAAFKRPVRVTNFIAETDYFRFCLLNAKTTGYLGVEDEVPGYSYDRRLPKVRATNIERTLIDIAVRPVYSGGVDE